MKKEKVIKLNENQEKIVCSSCGTENEPNALFCVKCGASLQSQPNNEPATSVIDKAEEGNGLVATPVENQTVSASPTGSLNYFKYIWEALIKPFDSFKKEEDKFENIKNTGIHALIVVGATLIFQIISGIISVVRVSSYFTSDTKWVWSNIKEINFLKLIGQGLLVYIGLIVLISGVYYLANLVVKKDAKFLKLVGVTTTALTPGLLAATILGTIIGLISTAVSTAVVVIGLIYSIVILLELMSDQIPLEDKNKKIYFHAACISIVIILGALISYKLVAGAISGGLLY